MCLPRICIALPPCPLEVEGSDLVADLGVDAERMGWAFVGRSTGVDRVELLVVGRMPVERSGPLGRVVGEMWVGGVGPGEPLRGASGDVIEERAGLGVL